MNMGTINKQRSFIETTTSNLKILTDSERGRRDDEAFFFVSLRLKSAAVFSDSTFVS